MPGIGVRGAVATARHIDHPNPPPTPFGAGSIRPGTTTLPSFARASLPPFLPRHPPRRVVEPRASLPACLPAPDNSQLAHPSALPRREPVVLSLPLLSFAPFPAPPLVSNSPRFADPPSNHLAVDRAIGREGGGPSRASDVCYAVARARSSSSSPAHVDSRDGSFPRPPPLTLFLSSIACRHSSTHCFLFSVFFFFIVLTSH